MDADKLLRGDRNMAMQPARPVWTGWTGAMPANGIKHRITWDEWCARLRRQRGQPQGWPGRNAAPAPRRGDVAARAFLAWFDGSAGDRHSAPFDDRELAVRRFMHGYAEAAATLDQFSKRELARLSLLRRRHQAG